MKFAHLADCHLGGWRQPELRQLNLESFQKSIDISINEKVDFVLIAGDLFDSAYPPIEILEETFTQLKKLKDAKIACYLIAGSHDYSASGKTFLSVLEKAGFCKNIYNPEQKPGDEEQKQIFLNPIIHKNVALYGYPGKKSGLEVQELKNVRLQESPGFFRVFALHTCIKDAVKTLPIESIIESELPEADYYALGHLHIDYLKDKFVYAGPTFPNNFQEMEELKHGRFYIIESYPRQSIRKQEIKIKDVEIVEVEVTNALAGTEKILSELNRRDLKDKIILLKVSGKLEQGKTSDLNFNEIENFAKNAGAYVTLKSTSKLTTEKTEIALEVENVDEMEEEIIKKYVAENKSKFNDKISNLVSAMAVEKQEGETTQVFQSRLFSELNKLLDTEI